MTVTLETRGETAVGRAVHPAVPGKAVPAQPIGDGRGDPAEAGSDAGQNLRDARKVGAGIASPHRAEPDDRAGVGDGGGRSNFDTQRIGASTIATLTELQATRRACIKAQIRLTNAAGAFVRRWLGWSADLPEKDAAAIKKRATAAVAAIEAGKTPDLPSDVAGIVVPFVEAAIDGRQPFDTMRAEAEKRMEALAKSLPVWPWVQGVKGFGAKGLAVIIGETGDLSNYANPGKVWKRLGLAPYDGCAGSTWGRESQRPRSLAKDEWIALGYRPTRRAEVFAMVDDMLLRHQWRAEKDGIPAHPIGPYGKVYGARRAHTAVTHPDWTPGHAKADATRYMAKRLIRDLWCVWNGREPTDPAEVMAVLAGLKRGVA